MNLNPEMQAWLAKSRPAYEFYLMHAIAHDLMRRSSLLAVPLVPEDFDSDELALMFSALRLGHNIGATTGVPMPSPPDFVYMLDHLRVAAAQDEMADETLRSAEKLLPKLLDPSFASQWYCIDIYFEAWLTTTRGKRYARKVQMAPVADMQSMADLIRRDIEAAATVTSALAVDEMDDVMDGTDMTIEARHSTGIVGLDQCLNGGWGEGECYLLFGGTGGGKSIAAAQCAWHEALGGGYPLIVSTELKAREYIARILSNACSIPINHLQDCQNFLQMRMAVAARPDLEFRLKMLDSAMDRIRQRLRVAKVKASDAINARSLIEREVAVYKQRYGRDPTWIAFDWIGTQADLAAGANRGTSERAMAWEASATSCVKFSEDTGIPLLVLAQAVNDAQTKSILTINDIGISKGMGKNMVAVIGVTNSIDKESVNAAVLGKGEMPKSMTREDQLFCVCKARKGEGDNVQVRRNFKYQRFDVKPKS